VIKRSKGRDNGDAERFLARDPVCAQDAPGPLRIADAGPLSKPINRNGQFGPAEEYFISEHLRELDSTRAPEVSAPPITYIRPAFEKYALVTVFFDGIEATFEYNEVAPRTAILFSDGLKRFGALAGALHECFAGGWS